MEPRGNPSGGDWALERMGAVMLEGVEDTLVAGCTFTNVRFRLIFTVLRVCYECFGPDSGLF